MNDLFKEDNAILTNKIDKKYFKKKRILITGATGLIGINLLCFLESINNNDIDTYIVHNNNLEFYFKGKFRKLQKDLTKISLVDYVGKNYFDIIFHLATYGQPNKMFAKKPSKEILETQLNTIDLNTKVIMDLFRTLKPKGKFLFMSTSEVYQGLSCELTEDKIGSINTNHPRASYIESKKMGEVICNIYKNMGYDVKIIRLCLAYGIGAKLTDKRVINDFIIKGIENNKITLLDKGMAKRSYCYTADVIEMILNILFKGKSLIYNVGGVEEVSIYELANKISKELNVKFDLPKFKDVNPSIGAVQNVSLNIDKYINEFGNKEFVSIDDGIEKTIDWFKFLKGGV